MFVTETPFKPSTMVDLNSTVRLGCFAYVFNVQWLSFLLKDAM